MGRRKHRDPPSVKEGSILSSASCQQPSCMQVECVHHCFAYLAGMLERAVPFVSITAAPVLQSGLANCCEAACRGVLQMLPCQAYSLRPSASPR